VDTRASAGLCKPAAAAAAAATARCAFLGDIDMQFPEDFSTHKSAWRDALQQALVNAKNEADASYWRHELAAFDRAYSELEAMPAADDPVKKAAEWDASDNVKCALSAVPPAGEWRGFAAECAMQYGAYYLDDDAEIFAISEKNLVNMMAVIGYPHGKAPPDA
jgi:hypothetical protein